MIYLITATIFSANTDKSMYYYQRVTQFGNPTAYCIRINRKKCLYTKSPISYLL